MMMKLIPQRLVHGLTAFAIACGMVAAAPERTFADSYPSQMVTLVVPYSAGTGIDIAARMLADKMQQRLKQPVIVENRVGAASNIGSAAVAKANPDGYTLLLVANTLAMSPSLFDLTYDPVKSFAPIGLWLKGAMVLVVSKDTKATNVNELVALAKANPGSMNYASPGVSTPQPLAMELFRSATGINMVHIPYKGAGDALTGLIRNEVSAMFMPVQSALPNLADGRIRAIGISSPVAIPQVANLKSIDEQIADKDFNVDLWYGMFAPAGTPAPVIAILAKELQEVSALPDVKARLQALALVPNITDGDQLSTLLKADMNRWARIIHQAGIAR
ncbi:MAG: Bug family tripartite tricarboxylate transporter substrate binding protein, partial [Pseudolabrys sp.]